MKGNLFGPRKPGSAGSDPRSVATKRRKRGIVGARRAIERMTVPSVEEVERRVRSGTSFLASLTPEQWEMIMSYDGPEILGRGGPKRKLDEPAD